MNKPTLAEFRFLMLRLAAESTVMVELLMEDAKLVELAKGGASYEEVLAYVNESF